MDGYGRGRMLESLACMMLANWYYTIRMSPLL